MNRAPIQCLAFCVRLALRFDPTASRRCIRTACTATALSAMLMLNSACALLIADPPPADIPLPDRYRAASRLDKGFQPAPDWWRSFGSSELDALVEQAISANHDIAAAVARIQQANAQTFVAGTQLIPAGGVSMRRSWSRASAAAQDTEQTGVLDEKLPVVRLWRLGLAASYDIDFWGKNAALVLAAKDTALASRYNRRVIELTVVTTLLNTYFEILAAQDRLRIANENLRVAIRVGDIIRQRVDAGTSTTIDQAQQDYIVVQQRALIPRLTRLLEQDTVALATLLGVTPDRVFVRGGGLRRLTVPLVSPGLPSELLLQRPDIQEAEARLASAAANLASARVALLPSFQLTGERGYESTLFKTLFQPQAVLYNVAASATQPIFDAPRLLGQIEFQEAVQRELLERYRQVIIAGLTDVERALIAIREIAREERLIRQSLAITRRGYELSESQLSAGAIDLTTMLNVQRNLFEAQDSLAQIRLSRFDAIVSLYLALGGGWRPGPVPTSENGASLPSPPVFDPRQRRTEPRP